MANISSSTNMVMAILEFPCSLGCSFGNLLILSSFVKFLGFATKIVWLFIFVL